MTYIIGLVDNGKVYMGSGGEYALGSLFSTYSHDPESRVRLAYSRRLNFPRP